MTTCRSTKIHKEHGARNADQGHTHHQGEIRDLPVEKRAVKKPEFKESYNRDVYAPEDSHGT